MSDFDFKKFARRQFVPLLTVAAAAGVCLMVWSPLLPGQSERVGRQTAMEASIKSTGCVSCHGMTDSASMHPSGTVNLGCVYCHGGNAEIKLPAGAVPKSAPYEQAKKQAYPQRRVAGLWTSSANPVRPAASWLME